MRPPSQVTLRRAIVLACRRMNALGINQGMSGNISARVPGGFLITPSGVPYETMRPEQVVFMDEGGGYAGELFPSSEWRMHAAIYAGRKEAGAVVHAHPPYATALSCLRLAIPAFHYMVAMAGGVNIRCAGYATFGTAALARHMMAALEGRRACLLANHGMMVFGADLERALALAVEVEALAMQYWLARLAGRPKLLPAAEMRAVLVRFQSYGKQPQELPPGFVNPLEPPPRRDRPAGARAEARRRAPVIARPRPRR